MMRTMIASLLFLGAIYSAIYAVHDDIGWLALVGGMCVTMGIEVIRK